MPEEPFKNREIIEMFNDLKNMVTRIEAQTTKTNGRVSSLENWKYMAMGGVSILSMLVVPLLVWALSILVNIDARIHASVDEALSAYEINP